MAHFDCGVEPNVRVEHEKETKTWGTHGESIYLEFPTPELAWQGLINFLNHAEYDGTCLQPAVQPAVITLCLIFTRLKNFLYWTPEAHDEQRYTRAAPDLHDLIQYLLLDKLQNMGEKWAGFIPIGDKMKR